MIAYLDSSVILRRTLGEAGGLAAWDEIEAGVCSVLARVECLRTIDRLHSRGDLTEASVGPLREHIYHFMEGVELVSLSPSILERAASPMPVPVGTLDALHIATAILWREVRGGDLVFATHDTGQARAARAFGFPVIG